MAWQSCGQKGNGLSVGFLGGTGFIFFSRRLGEKLTNPRNLLEEPNDCCFSSVFYSSLSMISKTVRTWQNTILVVSSKASNYLYITCAFLKMTFCNHACNNCPLEVPKADPEWRYMAVKTSEGGRWGRLLGIQSIWLWEGRPWFMFHWQLTVSLSLF